MFISVRAFASYREAIGAPSVRLDVPEGSSPGQVWDRLLGRYPRLASLPKPHAFAINEEYVQESYALRERDELVLIPPVSGGAPKSSRSPQSPQSSQSTEAWVELVERAIDVNALLERVKHPQAGGIVLFLGTVRDNDRGRHVKFLEYEAYQPMALKEMNRVVEEARRRWPLLGIAIVHRLGHLEVGDISVAIAVSSGHRKEAFEAGRYAIDTLKQTVPIWKKEVWDSGEAWIGSEVT